MNVDWGENRMELEQIFLDVKDTREQADLRPAFCLDATHPAEPESELSLLHSTSLCSIAPSSHTSPFLPLDNMRVDSISLTMAISDSIALLQSGEGNDRSCPFVADMSCCGK
jgi:hypothetical protein